MEISPDESNISVSDMKSTDAIVEEFKERMRELGWEGLKIFAHRYNAETEQCTSINRGYGNVYTMMGICQEWVTRRCTEGMEVRLNEDDPRT